MEGRKLFLAIAVMAIVTFSTRAFPFVVFGSGEKKPPALVTYLGKYLPPALICAIIVYCFKHISFVSYPFGLSEGIAAAAVVGLHLWKGNTMVSIFGGTAIYMVLVQRL